MLIENYNVVIQGKFNEILRFALQYDNAGLISLLNLEDTFVEES